MSQLTQLVMEGTIAGRIDRNTGIQILKLLKANEEKYIKDIAIIGIAGRFPKAESVDEFWDNIRNGTDCIGEFPENRKRDSDNLRIYTHLKEKKGIYCQGGYLNEIDRFDYHFFKLSPREASLMDPSQRIFLETAWHVLEDGGYGGNSIKGSRTGVYVGYNSWPIYGQIVSAVEPGSAAESMVGNLSSMIPSRIAYLLDLKGPAILIDTACSSSLTALHLACEGIKNGDCEMAIAGGVNIRLFPLYGEGDMGTDASDYRTKTFDESSDGTVWGEGAACVLIKPLERAIRDGDNIYAVIKGSCVNQDGASVGITAPNVAAQEDMLVRAWRNAGINPEDISCIEAHGTGTKLGDPIEVDAISRAFKRYTSKRQFCAIGSVKTNIGHLDSVSGLSGLIKMVMSLKNRELPPSLYFELPNHNINFITSPVYVNKELTAWNTDALPRRCGINSFGLSGTNCHFVLEEAPEKKEEPCFNARALNILTLSAKSMESLKALIADYKAFAGKAQDLSLEDICYTANVGRSHYDYRLALILKDTSELSSHLCGIEPEHIISDEDKGIYFSRHRIVPEGKPDREAWEVTDNEIALYDKNADELVRSFFENFCDSMAAAKEICKLYIKGANIDWSYLYPKGKTVRLPLYPFEKRRCWIEVPEIEESMFFKIQWEPEEQAEENNRIEAGVILLITKRGRLGKELVKELESRGNQVIEAEIDPDSTFAKESGRKYIIGGSAGDYAMLFNSVRKDGITRIVHCTTMESGEAPDNMDHLEASLQKGVYNLFNLIKGIHSSEMRGNINLFIITNGVNEVTGKERISPENGALAGLGKVINLESIYMRCRCIDIDELTDIGSIASELEYDFDKYFTAYRRGKRYVEKLGKLDISEYSHNELILRETGVYVITGGMGGIGLEISKLLTSKAKINLVFFNRTDMPDRECWDSLMKANEDKRLCHRIGMIREMERKGSTVTCLKVDVSEQAEVENAFGILRSRFGRINGIIHGAGVAGNGFLINKADDTFKSVLLPKVYGTWILDNTTREDNLDFFMMFSSGTAMFGDAGQGDYMAANAYLDSYVSFRKAMGKKTITVSWTGWKETGMAKDNNANIDATFIAMPTYKAINAFNAVLDRDISRVLIGELNYNNESIYDIESLRLPFYLSDEILRNIEKRRVMFYSAQGGGINKKNINVSLKGKKNNDYSELEREIAQIWGEVLGFDGLSIYDNFFELGGDSIKAVQVLVRLKAYKMDMKDLFQYPTIAALSRYITATYGTNGKQEEGKKNHPLEEEPLKHTDSSIKSTEGFEEKYLSGVKPFNDVLFKDCFYNAFFSAVRYFKRDIMPYVVNDFALYTYKDDKNGVRIGTEYRAIRDIKEIMEEQGLKAKTNMISRDVINDIYCALKKENPVIVRVDCFYEPIRADAFNSIHWSHSLLVYGYDKVNNAFVVLEQENMNSLTYKEKLISAGDMEKAYKGYLENFHGSVMLPTLYELEVPNGIKGKKVYREESHLETFTENLKVLREELNKSYIAIARFNGDFARIITDEQSMKLNLDMLLHELNEALKGKQMEKYKLICLHHKGLEDNAKILDGIISNYTYLKSVLGMYKLTGRLKEGLSQKLTERMTQIVNMEEKYQNNLFYITDSGGL